jgi:hypothetical protein
MGIVAPLFVVGEVSMIPETRQGAALNDTNNNSVVSNTGSVDSDDVNNVVATDEDDEDKDDEDNDEYSLSQKSEEQLSSANSVATDDEQSVSSNFTSSTGARHSETDAETVVMASKETRQVRCLRNFLLLFLVSLGTALSVSFFKVAQNREEEQMENDIEEFASLVASSLEANLGLTFGALDALAVQVTATTSSSSSETTSWPFVTLPDFHVQGYSTRTLAPAALSVSMVPIVKENQRTAYENYTLNNQEWITQAMEWQVEFGQGQRRRSRHLQQNGDLSSGIAETIYRIQDQQPVRDPGPGHYYPIRQSSPLTGSHVNYNTVTNKYVDQDLVTTVTNNKAVLGQLLQDDDDAIFLLQLLPAETKIMGEDPVVGTVFYPIFDQFTAKRTAVGLFSTLVSWAKLFEGILPPNVNGVIVVLKNSCDQQYTFQLDGPKVTVLGRGDLHSSDYNDFEQGIGLDSLDLTDYTTSRVSLSDESTCKYTLSVYPTDDFFSEYSSNVRVIYAAVVATVFFLAAVGFLWYDRTVERRQQKVSKSALEARAIVSSLFPANVRDRLFDANREKKEEQKKTKMARDKNKNKDANETPVDLLNTTIMHDNIPSTDKSMEQAPLGAPLSPNTMKQIKSGLAPPGEAPGRRKHVQHPKHRLKHILRDGSNRSIDDGNEFGLAKPIADLFPHTTVMFADISGFVSNQYIHLPSSLCVRACVP